MLTHYLQSFAGSDTLGVASLLLSMAAFLGVVLWAVRVPKATIAAAERLPLEEAAPAAGNDSPETTP